MKNFDSKYFADFKFSPEQIKKNLDNALKDLNIAKQDEILDVKFNYIYTALIKSGIALLSSYGIKVRSVIGHHRKVIEKLAELLKDESVIDISNVMRAKRNLDLYAGGVEVTEKECREYIQFAENVLSEVVKFIKKKFQSKTDKSIHS